VIPGQRRLRRPDATLHALDVGEGPLVVLLHGWPLDHRAFTPQLESLACTHRLLALDRRGFGRSSGPPDAERELDDLDAWLDHLGGAPVHLLGMSQGARIALRYAATRPERVRSLTLQGVAVDGLALGACDDRERIPLEAYAEHVRAGHPERAREAWLAHPMMRLHARAERWAPLLRAMVEGWSGEDLLVPPSEAGAPIDVCAAVDRLTMPVLVLTGEHETRSRREQAAWLVRNAPRARERCLADAGHLCNLEQHDGYDTAVAVFLHAVETGRA
jgi:pimeloyl-ACP methyl ester carboxylesterase